MLKKNKTQNYTAGFTLVEALVAISILMIAIASPMTLAQKGLSTATLSKDQMTAAFLAQDAIEAVKNIRDQTAIRGSLTNDWLDAFSNCLCTGDNNNCDFDSANRTYCVIDTTVPNWTTGGDAIISGTKNHGPLKISYNANNPKTFLKFDYKGENGSENSKFSRFINIKRTGGLNGNEAVVNVRVSWDSAQGLQKIDIQDFIYNYSENF